MLTLLALLPAALGNSTGMTGKSVTGCDSCHGSAADSTTTVSFGAPGASVSPGDTVPLTFTVATSNFRRTGAGLDVSVSGGTLAAGADTRESAGEITHSAPATMTGSSYTFSFTWIAPTTPGNYTFYGAGNAVNLNGADSGDGWNTTMLTLSVRAGATCVDVDGDGYPVCDDGTGTDCNDAAAAVNPGATEVCGGNDDDCDGLIDDADPSVFGQASWYTDGDGDGWGTEPAISACTPVAGYAEQDGDCDDTRTDTYPGAPEECGDVTDLNCDGVVGDGAADQTFWADADGDGYGDPAISVVSCGAPVGYVDNADDCDDSDGLVSPSAAEVCDTLDVDEDCDTLVDGDDPTVTGLLSWYGDGDGDGYGDAASVVAACDAPGGYVATADDCDDGAASVHPGATETCTDSVDLDCDGLVSSTDGDGDGYAACVECDDTDAAIHPGATEVCNGKDDNCDGTVDADAAGGVSTWYLDADGDGLGDTSSSTEACAAPSGYVATSGDCDDGDASVTTDRPWYLDADGDGHGTGGSAVSACAAPTGYAATPDDCNDGDAGVHPGATELCDAIDNNCNGSIDEAGAGTTWYADRDGDGWGSPTDSTTACTVPSGYTGRLGDCADDDATVNPDATEVWYDGVDQDCDGNDADQDGDGWATPDDCDDTDDAVSPDAAEVWYDGVDQDCDGADDFDQDGDGHLSSAWGGDDCNDTDATVYPGAPEVPDDGVVNDCAVPDPDDVDRDGWPVGEDCDDDDATVNPGAAEVWYDGVDQDCDGRDDDQDADGWGIADDCADTDPTTHPGAAEVWYDGLDQDCDGGDDWDADGDGHAVDWHGGDDCDDTDASVYPGAPDTPYDGVTTDCDASDEYDQDGDSAPYPDDCDDTDPSIGVAPTWYYDRDGDLYGDPFSAVRDCEQPADYVDNDDDCNDGDSRIHPGAGEHWYDGVDQNCDGWDDYDQDRDGHPRDEDCDEGDPTVWDACDSGETGDTGETGETGETGDTGETGETAVDDTAPIDDTSDDTAGDTATDDGKGGCACTTAPSAPTGLAALLAGLTFGFWRRKR